MLSWTKRRRSEVQRCPAVPTAAKRIARNARSRSADGVRIIPLLPPSSRTARPKRCATTGATLPPIRVEPVALTSGTRRSAASAWPSSGPPFARDHPPIELPRQADREVADIDHLLHFALALFEDLAGLDRHQAAERLL